MRKVPKRISGVGLVQQAAHGRVCFDPHLLYLHHDVLVSPSSGKMNAAGSLLRVCVTMKASTKFYKSDLACLHPVKRLLHHTRSTAALSSMLPSSTLASSIRALMRSSAQPVAVITTILPNETHVHGATLSSFTTVSLDPPLVAFSIRTPSRLAEALSHHSMSSDSRAHFVINILSDAQEDVAEAFAKPGLEPCPVTHLQASPAETSEGKHPLMRSRIKFSECAESLDGTRIPVLSDCIGALACGLEHRLDLRRAFDTTSQNPIGSSDLFVARIHAVDRVADENGRLPLIYWQRGFTTVKM